MKKYILGVVIVFSSTNVWSFTQCVREVKNVWNNMLDTQAVWVTFNDGGSAIYKTESQMTEGQMARFFSMVLAAQATGKSVIVRYPEDEMSCPPTGTDRNDVQGMWIKGS